MAGPRTSEVEPVSDKELDEVTRVSNRETKITGNPALEKVLPFGSEISRERHVSCGECKYDSEHKYIERVGILEKMGPPEGMTERYRENYEANHGVRIRYHFECGLGSEYGERCSVLPVWNALMIDRGR